MHDGSSPTIGTPRATSGASASSMRCASARASSTMPVARYVRPQQSGARRRAAVATRDAVAAGRQHRSGGAQVLGLEVGIEGVGEQHDLARRSVAAARGATSLGRGSSRGATAAAIGAPRSLRCLSESLASPGHAVAQIQERREARGRARVARQMRDEPVAAASADGARW